MSARKSLLLEAIEKQKSNYATMMELDSSLSSQVSGGEFLFNLLYLFSIEMEPDEDGFRVIDEPNPYAPAEFVVC